MVDYQRQTARHMLMAREPDQPHVLVEMIGGPLDGQRFNGVIAEAISHDRHDLYEIEGIRYRPDRVEAGVLYMTYAPEKRRREPK